MLHSRMVFSPTYLVVLMALGMSACSSSDPETVLEGIEDPSEITLDDGADAPATGEGDPLSETLLSEATVDDQLKQMVDVLNLTRMSETRLVAVDVSYEMQMIGSSVVDGEALPDHVSVASFVTTADDGQGNTEHAITYNCGNGGGIEQKLLIIQGPFARFDLQFSDCAWPLDEAGTNTEILDGNVVRESGRRSDTIITLDNFKRDTGDIEVTASGVHTQFYSILSNYDAQTWEEASLQVQDAQGSMSVVDFNWSRTARHGEQFIAEYLYALGTDNSAQRIVRAEHFGILRAGFTLTSGATGDSPMVVSAQADLDNPYLSWAPLAGTSAPDYPVSDLGDPLTYALTPEFETATFFTTANLPAPTQARWLTGGIDVTAPDGSTASMSISGADNPDEVLVEVNQSGELTSRPLSDGFELTCPEVLIGCE